MDARKFRLPSPPTLKFRLLSAPALTLALCAAPASGCEPRQAGRQPSGESGARQQQQGGQTPAATAQAGGGATADGRATPAGGGEGGQTVTTRGELKTLGEGGYSRVNEAFVFVARDEQGYRELRGLVPDLPEMTASFFEANAVVAAFLGRRRSGGYAVEIARDAEGALRVSEKSPPKDAMTTMALTAPYRVVSLSAPEGGAVRLRLDAAWRERARPYRVAAGEFTMMGGFAGVREPFTVGGTIGVLRYKDLATVIFDLKGADERRPRALADAASGAIDSGKLSLTVDPGTFILPPRGRLRAEGKFGPGENKLSLTLEGLQTKVADGFGGRGTLEAEATAAPPPKRPLDDGDPM